jgi:hypothetical protein
MLLGNCIGIPFYWRYGSLQLPSCARDLAISWHKNLGSRIDEGDTYPYVKDSIGNRTDTVYYGQYLESELSGLLNFDGIDDSVTIGGTGLSLAGDKKITFYLYLTTDSFPTILPLTPLLVIGENPIDNIVIKFDGNNIVIATSAGDSNVYDITGIDNTVLFCEIIKSTDSVDSFFINNIEQSSSGTHGIIGGESVGNGIFGSDVIGTFFDSGYIWDVRVYNNPLTTNTLTNQWLGYPDGNLDTAWEDLVGSIDGTVNGTPSTTSISSTINFLRTSGTFDYVDPSDGSLIEGVSIPATGLYTIPANGICDIGVYPRGGEEVSGVLNFNGDDLVTLSSIPDVTGSKAIEFSIYLDTVNYIGANRHIISFGSGNSDYFLVFLQNSLPYLTLQVSQTADTGKVYDMTGFEDTVLNCRIVKSTGGIDAFYINDVLQSSISDSTGVNIGTKQVIGGYFSATLDEGTVWDIYIYDDPLGVNTLTNNFPGNPSGDVDTSWDDTVGSITATLSGVSSTRNINSNGDITYTSFYPTCERAGTVLHDVTENSIHISVDTPSWSESLYGSDYLNQKGFVTKSESDALGYDWETLVNITPITLNDNTLVPLGQWDYQPLLDSLGDPITDSLGDPIYTKENL